MSVENQSEMAESWVAERLTEIKGIKDASERVEALVSLAAEMLPSRAEVLQLALEAANSIGDEGDKAEALSALAPRLPESEQHEVLQLALKAANSLEEGSKAEALSALAPQLPESATDLLQLALDSANSLGDEGDKAEALSALAPRLPESATDLLQLALEAARASDLVIIPCRPAILDLRAIGSTVDLVNLAKAKACIVLNAVPSRGTLAEEAVEAVSSYGVKVLPVRIGQRAAFVHALTAGKTAQEYEPNGKAAKEIKDLYMAICKHAKL